MNNFEISLHAKEQADEREISVETIFDVLKNPDKVEVEENGQLIYQKVIIENPVKKYLIRVFVNSNKNPNLVKTVYRTSKLFRNL